MKDKKRKENNTESDAFFEVDENIWVDDGGENPRKIKSGKSRHRNNRGGYGNARRDDNWD